MSRPDILDLSMSLSAAPTSWLAGSCPPPLPHPPPPPPPFPASSSSSSSLPDASITVIPSHDLEGRSFACFGSRFVEVDEWVAVLPSSTYPPPYYPTEIHHDGVWNYSPAALVTEAFPAFMEEEAELQWPSRSLYGRGVSSYNDAVREGARSWESSSWVGTLVPLLLAIISVVGLVPYICILNKQEHDKKQAMFQAVVRALRANNDELDEAWRATTGTEGRRRWQWRWVGRHSDSQQSSSRPRLALLHIQHRETMD
jgi:hypothetical protein